jgi:fucose 4-O-acetylase-like acetyltransferase
MDGGCKKSTGYFDRYLHIIIGVWNSESGYLIQWFVYHSFIYLFIYPFFFFISFSKGKTVTEARALQGVKGVKGHL